MSENMKKKLAAIEQLRWRLKQGGGEAATEKQHARGKLTARERIELLCDPGTFAEFDLFAKHMGKDYGLDKKQLPADGVITGFGEVNGRRVVVFSEDFTVVAGTFGEMHGRKICKAVVMARKMGLPLIGMNDSGGARATEEMGALSMYGKLFKSQARACGVVPQIALIMGPVAGGQAYSPSMMDFLFMVENTSHMFLAGPPLVKAVVFQDATADELGSARVHAEKTGMSDYNASDDRDCIEKVRKLLSYLPSSVMETPPFEIPEDDPDRADEELLGIIPDDRKKPYDMHEIIERIVDKGSFFELKPEFAKNLITGLARLDGIVVGIVANNPMHLAGSLTVNSSLKGEKFIRFCDSFNIPLINLQDVPGYLIGIKSERDGIIRHGSKQLRAYAEATVPMITIVLRKSYAGGYLGMCSKEIGADFLFALPTAEICLMGAPGAVNILFRKEIAASDDPVKTRNRRIQEFYDNYVDPTYAAGLQHVDDIIDPRQMRPVLIKSLEIAMNKVE